MFVVKSSRIFHKQFRSESLVEVTELQLDHFTKPWRYLMDKEEELPPKIIGEEIIVPGVEHLFLAGITGKGFFVPGRDVTEDL